MTGIVLVGSMGSATRLPAFLGPMAVQQSGPRCATAVDTSGWTTYRDDDYGITLQYPSTYVLSDTKATQTITLKRRDAIEGRGTITLRKHRGTLRASLDDSMELAGWKVRDNSTFALASPYLNISESAADPVHSLYLFVRDYPKVTTQNIIIRAEIVENMQDEEFREVKMARDGDLEGSLTVPEQILSTFRFLTNHEIYGPGGI